MQEIAAMMEAKQIPVHVWLPIMHLESAGNVYAHNPRGEDSRGLFQINLQAGPGGAHTPDFVRGVNLFDPLENARAILSEHWLGHRDRIKRMLGLLDPAEQATYMYRHGIRPQFTPELERRVRFYATDGLAGLMARYGLDPVARQEEQPWPQPPEDIPGPQPFTAETWMRTPGFPQPAPRPDITPETWMRERVQPREGPPSWINPFERLAWEWGRVWPRVLIVVFGVPVLVLAVVLLFMQPEDVVGRMGAAGRYIAQRFKRSKEEEGEL